MPRNGSLCSLLISMSGMIDGIRACRQLCRWLYAARRGMPRSILLTDFCAAIARRSSALRLRRPNEKRSAVAGQVGMFNRQMSATAVPRQQWLRRLGPLDLGRRDDAGMRETPRMPLMKGGARSSLHARMQLYIYYTIGDRPAQLSVQTDYLERSDVRFQNDES